MSILKKRPQKKELNLPEEGSDVEAPLEPKKRRRGKGVKKVLLIIFGILLFIVVGGVAGFSYLRVQGEKGLKTEIPEPPSVVEGEEESDQEEAASEAYYITYQNKKYQYDSDVINFLCLGIDKDIPIEEKRETGSEGLSDAIMLVSINTRTNQVKIIAVPRDTVVPVKVLDTSGKFLKTENKQITLQYAYGRTAEDSCELMVDAVSNLMYQIPIQRYCSINFQALPVLNDAIGGVRLVALETVEWQNGGFYAGQELHLQGQTALDYVRQRDESVPNSSMGRLERQKQYITGYMDQAKAAIKNDMTLPIKLFQELTEHMCTNVKIEDITYLVPELLEVSLTGEDMMMVPGDVVQGAELLEYHVQTDALKEMVIQNFYKEIGEGEEKQESDSIEGSAVSIEENN